MQDGHVGVEMLGFRGIGMLAEIKELGAIQSDSPGSAFKTVRRLAGKLDVSQQLDANTVLGLSGQIAKLAESGFKGSKGSARTLITLLRLQVRVKDHDATVAVH